MEVIIAKDYGGMSRIAAHFIAGEIRRKPDLVLGLATGATPLGTYRELVRLHREEGLDFSKVTSFNLDEYIGLSPLDKNSYHFFMSDNLFRLVNIRPDLAHVPRGDTGDPEGFCARYEERIREAGGIDLQLLGIGTNGHIGFNEPGSSFGGRTRVQALTRQTIEANARYFGGIDGVPRFAITMGVGTILESKRILLIANGRIKADVCAGFIEGPVTSQITATALQLHRDPTVVLDEEAASKLTRMEYYNWVRDNKLPVQKSTGT
jgi:glucosamine-6-phosphate deaminase